MVKYEPTTDEDRLNSSAVVRGGTAIDDSAVSDVSNMARLSTNILIATDGTAKTIANRMDEDDKQKRQSMHKTIQRLFARQLFKRYSGWRQPAHPQDHPF